MKSKERQRENSAAQSVMEGFKAYSLEDIEKQFSDPAVPLRIYNTSNVTDANGASVQSLGHFACLLKDGSGNVTTDLKNVDNYGHPQEFMLYDVNYQGKNFDVKVTTTPSVLKDITYIENMNGFQDCIYEQPIDEQGAKYYDLLSEICKKLNELDEIYGYAEIPGVPTDPDAGYKVDALDLSKIIFTRTTNVTITDSKVTVSVVYNAKADHYPYYNEHGTYNYLTQNFTITVSDDYYDNSSTGATLENVFLFVFPAYSSNLAMYPYSKDIYNITSNSTRNVYFVKQKDNSVVNLTTCENAYNPEFHLTNVAFYHNLKDNLGGGLTTGAATFSSIGTSTIQDGLSFDEPQAFIYEVEVAVYDAGTLDAGGEAIYTLNGTKNDK